MKGYIIGGIIVVLIILGGIDACTRSCSRDKEAEKVAALTEMLENNDFKSANKYVAQLYANRKNDSDYSEWGVVTEKYLPAAILTLKAEASYLMDQDDPEAERLFMLCLNDVSGNIGNCNPNNYNENKRNIEEITAFNKCLIAIIKEALIKDKGDFAIKLSKMVRMNYNSDGREDNSQIEEAQQLIEEAQ